MAAQTTAARLARIEAAIATLVAAQAPAPVAKVKSAKVASPSAFVTYLHAKALASTGVVPAGFDACAIHDEAECNRSFRPGSAGNASHVARIGKA